MTHHTARLDPFASARAMLAALEVRQISATELLEQHLARIARYNPTLNAIVTPNEEQARKQGHYLGVGFSTYVEACGLAPSQVAVALGAQAGDMTAQHVVHGHLKGGHGAAGGGPAEQIPVPLVGRRLTLVGEHHGYAVTNEVYAAQSRVVQDAVFGQVQQCLLVYRACQQV